MNAFIEGINLWGERFLHLAGPMLWQSSLLIAVVFTLDLALRKKLRAVIRYTLWLVVLVKLLLPPALALPTGLAWWVRQAPPLPAEPLAASAPQFVVTYHEAIPRAELPPFRVAEIPLPPLPAPPPPSPTLSSAGWTLVASVATGAVLLTWMFIRWRQVARDVKAAAPPSEMLIELLTDARRSLNMRRPVRLRLTDRPMSPAVCGLFRATILLPRSLVKHLTTEQLRAVLLHELIHLRRGDVWVNCAQALLQVVYWWHPLLWFANARIRRVREEAVDDAVMLALREEAEAYAPTLLEVAKLAFHRPLASLGLVGILESRSALRQRIERLVNFEAPRRAGLSLLSVLGIAAFTAVAAPMGNRPAMRPKPPTPPTEDSQATAAEVASPEESPESPVKITGLTPESKIVYNPITQVTMATNGVAVEFSGQIFTAESVYYDHALGRLDAYKVVTDEGTNHVSADRMTFAIKPGAISPKTLTADPYIDPAATKPEIQIRSLTTEGNVKYDATSKKIIANNGAKVEFSGSTLTADSIQVDKNLGQIVAQGNPQIRLRSIVSSTNQPAAASKLPPGAPDPHKKAPLIQTSKGRQAIMAKLDKIRLENVSYDAIPLAEVLAGLSPRAKEIDATRKGINFLLNPNGFRSTIGSPDPAQPLADVKSIPITIKPPLTNARLADILDAIVKGAATPIKFSVEEYAVTFSLKGPETEELYIRTFAVDANALCRGLERAGVLNSELTNSAASKVPAAGVAPKQGGLRYITVPSGMPSISKSLLSYFKTLGVDLGSPQTQEQGKSIFWNDRLGQILVRATTSDLDKISAALDEFAPPNPSDPGDHAVYGLSVAADGSYWLGTNRIDWETLKDKLANALRMDPNITLLIEADKDAENKHIATLSLLAKELKFSSVILKKGTIEKTLIPEPSTSELDRQTLTNRANAEKILKEALKFNSDLNKLNEHRFQEAARQRERDFHATSLESLTGQLPDRKNLAPSSPQPYKTNRLTNPGNDRAKGQPAQPGTSSLSAPNASQDLKLRSFRVDPNTFYQGLEAAVGKDVFDAGRATANHDSTPRQTSENVAKVNSALTDYFITLGINLRLDSGKTAFWHDRVGELLVRATPTELDMIEVAIQALNRSPQQINIRAKFVEITEDDNRALGLDWIFGKVEAGSSQPLSVTTNSKALMRTSIGQPAIGGGATTNSTAIDGKPAPMNVILTDPQFRVMLRMLAQRSGVDVLACPEVTTVSGRQAQVQMADIKTIVNGITNSTYTTAAMPFGPVVDLIPIVSPDGQSVQLTVIATVNEFLGYDDPEQFVPSSVGGAQGSVLPLPRFRSRQLTTTANLWDGQTLVLGGAVANETLTRQNKELRAGKVPTIGRTGRNETKKRTLLVFVTVTMLDPAGNRLHTDDEPKPGSSAPAK